MWLQETITGLDMMNRFHTLENGRLEREKAILTEKLALAMGKEEREERGERVEREKREEQE